MHLRFVLLILFSMTAINGCSSAQGTNDSDLSEQSQDATRSKQDELDDARRGPTATKMAGNAEKWRGSFVHFPCKITNVIDGPAANAMCGLGVTAKLDTSAANVDYSDPSSVDKAMRQLEKKYAGPDGHRGRSSHGRFNGR